MQSFVTKRVKLGRKINLLKHHRIKYKKFNNEIELFATKKNKKFFKNLQIQNNYLFSKMNKYIIIIATIFLFICNLNLFATATKQLIVEHPQNTTARIGDTVILKCRVENQVNFLKSFIFKIF